jgi:hypothetical protein
MLRSSVEGRTCEYRAAPIPCTIREIWSASMLGAIPQEYVVQVHCDEGIAIHIGPEPCVGARESEASAGDRTDRPSSREIDATRVPTLYRWWKATRTGALARTPARNRWTRRS